MRALILLLFPVSVFAGGLIPGVPSGGGVGVGVGVNADNQSGAYAGNQGNSQNIIFRQNGGPGRQVIESTPGLGAMYTPMTSDCYIAVSGQGTGMTVGVGATVPILALPCHFRNLAKDTASIGVAMYNTGSPEAMQEGRETVSDGIDMIECTDVNMYLIRKAKGRRPCPVMPDRGISDIAAGGMIDEHVIPTPGYSTPKPVAATPPPVYYQPPPSPNPALDNIYENQMRK